MKKKSGLSFFFIQETFQVCALPRFTHLIEESRIFEKANCVLIGCSTDSKNSHKAWMEKPRTKGGIDKLSYPLMADPSLRITRSYGVLQRELGQALRGTFVINDEGILMSMAVNPARIGRSVDETVRTLQALQTGMACPAGWRPGRKTF